MTIFDLIDEVAEHKASDLHLVAGAAPALRVNGELLFKDKDKLTPDDVKKLSYELLNDERKEKFKSENELDFSYSFFSSITH